MGNRCSSSSLMSNCTLHCGWCISVGSSSLAFLYANNSIECISRQIRVSSPAFKSIEERSATYSQART